MKKFYLERVEDESGVSGTGRVAEGISFSDRTAVLRWLTDTASFGIYTKVEDISSIHGHGGKTRLVWETPDSEVEELKEKLAFQMHLNKVQKKEIEEARDLVKVTESNVEGLKSDNETLNSEKTILEGLVAKANIECEKLREQLQELKDLEG